MKPFCLEQWALEEGGNGLWCPSPIGPLCESLLALVWCPSPLWPLYGARVPFGPCTVPDSLVALVWCPIPFGAMVPESLWALVLCTSPFGAMVPESLYCYGAC
jgi:hypothetical protein